MSKSSPIFSTQYFITKFLFIPTMGLAFGYVSPDDNDHDHDDVNFFFCLFFVFELSCVVFSLCEISKFSFFLSFLDAKI